MFFRCLKANYTGAGEIEPAFCCVVKPIKGLTKTKEIYFQPDLLIIKQSECQSLFLGDTLKTSSHLWTVPTHSYTDTTLDLFRLPVVSQETISVHLRWETLGLIGHISSFFCCWYSGPGCKGQLSESLYPLGPTSGCFDHA